MKKTCVFQTVFLREKLGGAIQQKGKLGVRGILAIILASVSLIALVGCGDEYNLGTAPGAETQHCMAAQVGQGGKQSSPVALKPHSALPNEAMFGFDAQHTSYHPYEHIIGPTNVSRLVLK
jgi:hypothetical protein